MRVTNSTFIKSADAIIIMSQNERGRLVTSKQLILQKDLRKYYVKGISATTAADSLDVNVKTACRYFKQWSKEIHGLASKKFQDQIMETKAQNLIVLDKQLEYLYDLQDKMNDKICVTYGDHGGSSNYNFRERLASTKIILGIMDKKTEILEIQA